MISVRRASSRHHERFRKQEYWRSFDSRDEDDPLKDGFGALEWLDELRLEPGASPARRPRHDAEVFVYTREGALAWEDSSGRVGILTAGEFQRLTSVRGLRHGLANASQTDQAHAFHARLRLNVGALEPAFEQRRFSAAERRGGLCLVASPDGRGGSLTVRSDALVFSGLLHAGLHVVHALPAGRSAYLHLVEGAANLDGLVLETGDGAVVTGERAVSLTAREETEVLLFDLGGPVIHPTPEEKPHA